MCIVGKTVVLSQRLRVIVEPRHEPVGIERGAASSGHPDHGMLDGTLRPALAKGLQQVECLPLLQLALGQRLLQLPDRAAESEREAEQEDPSRLAP